MNKKILTVLVAILAAVMVLTPMIGMVQAGKGQEKLFFEISITQIFEPVFERNIRCSPIWETPPFIGGDANVVFVEIDYSDNVLSVKVGEETFVPNNVGLETGVLSSAVYWNGPTPGSKVIDKDEFILDFSDLFGTTAKIEISRVAKKEAAGLSSGTFVGHGTDFLKGVTVSGKQTSAIGDITGQSLQLTGTVIGWPGLP